MADVEYFDEFVRGGRDEDVGVLRVELHLVYLKLELFIRIVPGLGGFYILIVFLIRMAPIAKLE